MSKFEFVTLQNRSGKNKAITLKKDTYELPTEGIRSFSKVVADKMVERFGSDVEVLSFNLIDASVTNAEIYSPNVKWLANNTGNPYLDQVIYEDREDKATKKIIHTEVRVPYATFQTITGMILPNETHVEESRNGFVIPMAKNDGKREILKLAPLSVKPVTKRLGQSMLNMASQNIKGNFANLVQIKPLIDAEGGKTFVPDFYKWSYADLRNYLFLCLDDPNGTEAKYLGVSAQKLNYKTHLDEEKHALKQYEAKVALWINLYFKLISAEARLPTEQEFKDFVADDIEETPDANVLGKELHDQEQSV